MRFEIGVPLIVKNVKIAGPKGSVSVDLILDTGAAFTAISWSVLKNGRMIKWQNNLFL
jgi:hypothetical protein